jgi:hypothetical protein
MYEAPALGTSASALPLWMGSVFGNTARPSAPMGCTTLVVGTVRLPEESGRSASEVRSGGRAWGARESGGAATAKLARA